MLTTMQNHPLTIGAILRHGACVYSDSEVVTLDGERCRRATFAEVAVRAERLAAALDRLGIRPGDRVGTFAWNTQEHLEAYLAVPAMGAVLHTLDIGLFPDQIVYTTNHADDRVLVVDSTLAELIGKLLPEMKTVKHVIVVGDADVSGIADFLRYEDLITAERRGFAWPEVHEHAAAAMCYTSGTTGHPKSVVYSHRSTFLHSMAVCSGGAFGLDEHQRILAIVPMFHANAWGLPYAGWLAGADLILPGRFLQPAPLCRLIGTEKPTFAGAAPTVWNDILQYAEAHPVDFSSLRWVVCGGSAVPLSLMERFQERFGAKVLQAWGMTETSPLGAFTRAPAANVRNDRKTTIQSAFRDG